MVGFVSAHTHCNEGGFSPWLFHLSSRMSTDMSLPIYIQILQTSNSGFFQMTVRNAAIYLITVCVVTAHQGTPDYLVLFHSFNSDAFMN